MRCLYCGKQLPLLKKLTGGGEFCSEAHRQKYQEEYNKLALSRLLQTQNADSEAPRRGELVLASRQHPALQAGRPPLRALEAPKSADSPLTGNWTPGANRTQRALPPPSPLPQTSLPGSVNAKSGLPEASAPAPQPPAVNEAPSFLKPSIFTPPSRPPLPTPQSRQESKPEAFRYEQRTDPGQPRLDQGLPRLDQGKPEHGRPEPISNRSAGTKRDAFTFRPTEPFPQEKPAPPPPPPTQPPPVATAQQPFPVAAIPKITPPPVIAARAPEPAAPPEGAFLVEEVRRQEPQPVPKLQELGAEPFTKGHPPKPDGWLRREPPIQEPPGMLEEPDELFPLSGPPGSVGDERKGQVVSQQEESEQEREEIRKKILENQVKPGDFKQMVPTAPSGPNTVLPIRPPAAALEQLPVTVRAKAPAANPSVFVAPASSGVELWNGWTLSGNATVRASLFPVAPEVSEAPVGQEVPQASPVKETVEPLSAGPVRAVAAAAEPAKPVAVKPVNLTPVAKPPVMVEAPRNYKAAEALKSAAQNVVIVESAPKVEVRQPEKPSTPRHEVFVDLSVLGIEEDEDADAEFLAREGESPPGGPPRRRRRNSNAREASRDLVSLPHPPASPEEPTLAYSFQALAWKQPSLGTPRLSTPPLRPKVVFEPQQQAPVVAQPQAEAKTQPAADETASLQKQSSSLAAAWSAKRLKKVETGTPHTAPGDSGQITPVETPVSEPNKTVSSAAPAIETAKIEQSPAEVPVEPPAGPAAKVEVAPANQAPAHKEHVKPLPQPVAVQTGSEQKLSAAAPPAAAQARTVGERGKAEPPKAEMRKPEAQQKPEAQKPETQRLAAKKPEIKKSETKPIAAKTVDKKTEDKKAPEPKTARVAAATPAPIPLNPPFEAPLLGTGAAQSGSFWANLPVLPKLAIALCLTAAIGGGAWFTVHPQGKASSATAVQPTKAKGPAKAGRNILMNLTGGWSPDWGGDFNRKKNRTITLYRPSINHDDYRMEFEGQIDSKALGWVYRAADPKNYYGYKIEIIRTGPDPGAALAHFAMVNGDEGQKHYTPLSKPIRPGASFRVRVDVLGDEFSAYINDELIEVWQDDRLAKGGFGVMTETGEIGQIRKLQVFELLP